MDSEEVSSLIQMIREGDDSAFEKVFDSYLPLIKGVYKETRNRLYNLSYDEAMQAARIGLFNAVYYYRTDRDMAFHNFARLCIKREIYGWQRKEINYLYHDSMRMVSLDQQLNDNEGIYLYDTVADGNCDVSSSVISKISFEGVLKVAREVSDKGERILRMRMQGYSYREIGAQLNISSKTVDNIIQSIRKKAREQFKNA